MIASSASSVDCPQLLSAAGDSLGPLFDAPACFPGVIRPVVCFLLLEEARYLPVLVLLETLCLPHLVPLVFPR